MFLWCYYLGVDVGTQFFGNKLMSVYNKKVFLVTILTRRDALKSIILFFTMYLFIHIQGVVALFTMRNKKNKKSSIV